MSEAGLPFGIVLGGDKLRVRKSLELENASRTIQTESHHGGKFHAVNCLLFSFFNTSRDGGSNQPWGAVPGTVTVFNGSFPTSRLIN